MTPDEISRFLSETRLGLLTTLRNDGSPVTVPVWFEWDGRAVRLFSSATSPKLRRIANDPRATLVATNRVDEPEAWVAFDGNVEVSSDGAIELAERLARRYWDMERPEHQQAVASWREAAAALRVLSIVAPRVRSYGE